MAVAVVLGALRALHPRTLAVLPPAPGVSSAPWTTSSVRTLHLCPALCAGHNKWSKVKHIKGPKDEARAKVFMKLGMAIRQVVKEGGPNPELNLNLAQILEQCRNQNMPKASVDAAIKSADKPMSQHMFEVRGPGGCQLLVEVLTDSIGLSHNNIKRLLNKNGGTLSDGVRHSFTRKGVVTAVGKTISMERALELAIEAGAEDVQETEDEEEQPLLKFISDTTDLNSVRASLEKLGMQIESSGVEFIPNNLLSLDNDQMDIASTLIAALNEYPDVVRVWDNIQADS